MTLVDERPENPVPNPGSDAAIHQGCSCSRWDNNRGLYPPRPGNWWITVGCTVHDPVPDTP